MQDFTNANTNTNTRERDALILLLPPTMKSLFAVLALAVAANAATALNFSSSCDANSIKVSGRTLTANCKNILGQMKCSKLDLNLCLKNRYGALEADPIGAG